MSIHYAGYDDCPCNNSLIPCISAIVSGPKQHTREKWSLYEADHIVCGYMKGKCHGRCTLRRQGTLACSHTCIFLKAFSPGVTRVSLVPLRHAVSTAGLRAFGSALLRTVGCREAAAQIALLLHLPQDFQRSCAGSILHSTCIRQRSLFQPFGGRLQDK